MKSLIALKCSFASREAWATTYTLSGQLSNDLSVVEVGFSVGSTETDTFFTTSYAGGLNANGSTTQAGGFDPVLTLYTGAGHFLADGGGATVCNGSTNADSITGLCNDAYFTQALTAGSYILAITEFPFYPNGDLLTGFFSSVDPTAISDACSSSTPFLESDIVPCLARTNQFTVNISPGLAGIIITQSQSILQTIYRGLRFHVEVEQAFNSVERITEYLKLPPGTFTTLL